MSRRISLSIDALLFAPDKRAALREIARVLAPGGRLVATTWDYRSQPVNRPPQVDDHRPLLAEAGFHVIGYDETPRWLENHRARRRRRPRRGEAVRTPPRSAPASRRWPQPSSRCRAAC